MGHMVNQDRAYRLLQQRLDRMVTGAPNSPVLMKILNLLFSPEEAEFATRIPGRLTSLGKLSVKLGIPRDELDDKMTEMARRGLVIDLARKGKRYFALAPMVIGFFEMTFMRTRDELPMVELAQLFDQYMDQDDRFARAICDGQTQLGRPLVQEESIPETDHTEILDWERASHIIRSASPIGVSLCACRHKASHLDKACDQPRRVCLSLNFAAESVIRNEMAESLTVDQAMRILEECKQSGLVQMGDNVQRNITYICNCCGCCCEMLGTLKRFDSRHAIVTSNWIMEVDTGKCKGCGKCAKACPMDAIRIAQEENGQKPRKWAVCDEALCLGCGVCYHPCKSGAIVMKPRSKRVLTPETVFDRVVAMAIERGKLTDLIFDNPQRLSHRALGRITSVIEKSPFFKAAMAIKPLRSAFLTSLVGKAKKKTAAIGKTIE